MAIKFFGAFNLRKEPSQFHMYRPDGIPAYLLLHFLYPVAIVLKHMTITTEKNACIIYKPGSYQEYYALSNDFVNNYVMFMPEDKNFMEIFNLPVDEVFYIKDGDSLAEHFSAITWAMTDRLNDNSERMNETLKTILNILAEQRIFSNVKEQREYQDKKNFVNLREEVRNHPDDWTVEKMAKAVFLTRSHFSILYSKYFGIPPGEDLINITMDLAKKLLSETCDPIHIIAKKCGYSNTQNFIRLFNKKEGITPGKYRKR